MSENKPVSSTPLDDLDKEALIAIIMEQREQIALLSHQVKELQDQVARNSRNSGKPPSSDGLKKPTRKSLRKKGKRPNGGQQGHEGQTLERVSNPDHVIQHRLAVCPCCTANLTQVEVADIEKRQVFDVPPIRVEVTEHQAEIKWCPQCGQRVKGPFPDEVTHPTQYGLRLKAQAIYLNTYQLLPFARICELFGDWYGHTPSQSLILNANRDLAEQLIPGLEAIRDHLIASDVIHCDESGLRVVGKLNWLHVVATERLTYYTVHPRRGQVAMQDMGILPHFQGRAIHDAWASYFQFENCSHALCNVHHLRELQFILDQYQQAWAGDMIHLLHDIKAEVEQMPPEDMRLPPERLAHYQQRYEALLQRGRHANPPLPPPTSPKRGRKKQSPPQNLLDRLTRYRAETLAFMADFRVPFDNNLAERDIRMMKVKQKISGTFRTTDGAEMFCAIRSYISTLRKQGKDVITAIYDALCGSPFIPTYT
jgi:transposase